ncbi:MAG: DUF5658 family protein [Planctomycetota bacterium]
MAYPVRIRSDGGPTTPLAVIQSLLRRTPGEAGWLRARRVVLLLVMLAMLNAFDLTCTIAVRHHWLFEEANPVARRLMDQPTLMVLFKVSLVSFAAAIFFVYRTRRVVELACWCVCLLYVVLAFLWMHQLHWLSLLV